VPGTEIAGAWARWANGPKPTVLPAFALAPSPDHKSHLIFQLADHAHTTNQPLPVVARFAVRSRQRNVQHPIVIVHELTGGRIHTMDGVTALFRGWTSARPRTNVSSQTSSCPSPSDVGSGNIT
jgi:hypothetical protein